MVSICHHLFLSSLCSWMTVSDPGMDSVEQSQDSAEQAPLLSVVGLSKELSDQPLTWEIVFRSSLHVHVGHHLIRGRFNIFILYFPGGTALHVSPQRAGLCLQGLFMCTVWYICVQC